MSNLIILGIVLLGWIALNMIAAFIWFYMYQMFFPRKPRANRMLKHCVIDPITRIMNIKHGLLLEELSGDELRALHGQAATELERALIDEELERR